MPTFPTPGPVTARIEVASGPVRVHASDRTDTVVTVRPSDPHSAADVTAAEQAVVDLSGDRLVVRTSGRPRLLFLGNGAQVTVDVDLPAGSTVEVQTGAGSVTCTGRLAAADLRSKHGELRLQHATTLRARTSSGAISADTVDGDAELSTSFGDVRVGEAGGQAQLDTDFGDIRVDRTLGTVGARTRYGQVRVGEAVRGALTLETAFGGIEAGVRRGTAAWLDLDSRSGRVRTELDEATGPDDATDTVEIHARTSFGDVVVHRA
ncbi:DUF4097 family beta strand repeat-containing protein [Blastococcus sp. SYSU D00695]